MSLVPYINRYWFEWEFVGGSRSLVLVVESTLQTQPHHIDFDASALDNTVNDLLDVLELSPLEIERVRIIPEDVIPEVPN